MRKKARIDVLEIQEPEVTESEPLSEEETEGVSEPEVRPRHRFFNWKIILLTVLSLCVVIVLVIGSYYLLAPEKKKMSPTVAPAVPAPHPDLLELDGLSCVVNDDGGNLRMVLFGVTIVPAPGRGDVWNTDNPDLRSAVIRVVSETNFSELHTVSGRAGVKRRLMESLESEQGKVSINAIFITSWTIL